MSTSTKSNIGLFLARIPLGLLFLLAGYMKVVKIGVGTFAADSMKHLPVWMPQELGKVYLYALPFVEFAVGLFLIVGLLARTSAFVASLILVSILIAMGLIEPGKPFATNVILLGLALLLSLLGAGDASIDKVMQRKKSKPQAG